MPRTPKPRRRAARRLSAETWVEAGLRAVIDGGLGSVRIDSLAERLGVTKGSFYWHFADLQTFLAAVAESWAKKRSLDEIELAANSSPDPLLRLRTLMRLFVTDQVSQGDRALRDWSQRDPKLARAVERADAAVFGFLADIFAELGLSRADAEMRARLMFWSGVGSYTVDARLGRPRADEMARVLAFFTHDLFAD